MRSSAATSGAEFVTLSTNGQLISSSLLLSSADLKSSRCMQVGAGVAACLSVVVVDDGMQMPACKSIDPPAARTSRQMYACLRSAQIDDRKLEVSCRSSVAQPVKPNSISVRPYSLRTSRRYTPELTCILRRAREHRLQHESAKPTRPRKVKRTHLDAFSSSTSVNSRRPKRRRLLLDSGRVATRVASRTCAYDCDCGRLG